MSNPLRWSKPLLMKRLKDITACYGVKLIYHNKLDGGLAYSGKNFIRVGSKNSKRWMIEAVFHELGHVYCWCYNKYWTYHHFNSSSLEQWYILNRTAVRAELYADKKGEEIMREWFPSLRFTWKWSYSNPKNQKFLRKYWELDK